MNDLFTVKENDMTFTSKNGNEIISAGLDDVEKLKSIANITGIWIEEATEISHKDFNQLDLRLRGETQDYKQIIMTYNPIWTGHWLNKTQLDDCWEHKSTYLDNAFLDEKYRKVLDDLKHTDMNMYNVYALGNWGSVMNADRVYYQFSRNHLFSENPLLALAEIIISFDFNVNPMTAVMLAFVSGKYSQTKEWKVNNSNTEEVAELVASHILNLRLNKSVILTGDASGRAKGTKGYMSDYEIIQKVFQRYGIQYILRVPTVNPPVRDRVNCVNKMFQSRMFEINEECIYSIQDRELITWKKGAEGFHIDKSDPELTHLADAADYGIWNTKLLIESENQNQSGFMLGGQRRV